MARIIAFILMAGSLASCSSTPIVTEDVGMYRGKKYLVTLQTIPDGLKERATITINDELVLSINNVVEPNKDSNCQFKNTFSWKCEYKAIYQGNALSIKRTPNAQLRSQYTIYMNGELITNISH